MEDFIPVIAILSVFGTITAIIVGPSYFKTRERRDMQKTVRAAIDASSLRNRVIDPFLLPLMVDCWARRRKVASAAAPPSSKKANSMPQVPFLLLTSSARVNIPIYFPDSEIRLL